MDMNQNTDEDPEGIICSKEEFDVLKQIKKLLGHLEMDDMSLIRFLRARNLNMEKAEEMINANLAWRIEYEIDSLETWDPPKEISDGFDIYHCGRDLEGRQVYYAPIGIWGSPRDLFAKGLEEDCMKYAAKSMDFVYKQLLPTRNQNFICIVDITGATYRRALHEIQNLRGIQDLIWLFRDYEANYPETLHKAFVINTPSVFYWGFNIVKPLMTKRTLSKINIFDNADTKWKSALREHLPENVIPEKLGGSAVLKSFY